MGTTMVKFASKNAIQILFFIFLLNKVNCVRPLGRQGLSPLQEAPQYRFHYFVQDDNLGHGGGTHKTHDEHKNAAIVTSTPVVQNGPVYNAQTESQTPIVVESTVPQIQQKSSKSIESESNDESNKTSEKIDLTVSGRTEDRQDDDDKDSTQEQVYVQDKDESMKQPSEFTIPFKKPNTVGVDDVKYDSTDEEVMKKDIVKVIQNINGAGLYSMDHSNSHSHMKNGMSEKPMKIFNSDSIESDHVDIHSQLNNGESHINFKSQQLSNKPLRLFGYNPFSTVGSTYDMDIKPQPILGNVHGSYFYGDDAVKNVPTYDANPMYSYYPPVYQYPGLSSGGYKGGLSKYNSAASQQLYYYDPNSMLMIPIYPNTINGQTGGYQQFMDNGINTKPQPSATQLDMPNKKGFNLMQILNGGTYYKSAIEQAEGSQTTMVKDMPATQESNKQEPIKTDKPKAPSDDDKSKPVQTLMLYLSPNDSPLDLKKLSTSPIQLMVSQQPLQNNCSPKNKTPVVKEKPLPLPIPLCSDCVPALGLIGLPNTKAPIAVQTKISAASPTTTTPQPQIMPIWNGQNTSKFNYLILPNPITK
ncbi:uncharacterized protein LOC126905321 [Daktulosphaira vitifoliae]|uniref:uncharacterized protein LOC126905321 n=1 Tax=Daktulosphaira vitifoliae TaxID=58002 RepID=UPI0021AA035C|nr:uncharacterized protein LOC126905321 [Daktulosphaira vitifoliae]